MKPSTARKQKGQAPWQRICAYDTWLQNVVALGALGKIYFCSCVTEICAAIGYYVALQRSPGLLFAESVQAQHRVGCHKLFLANWNAFWGDYMERN